MDGRRVAAGVGRAVMVILWLFVGLVVAGLLVIAVVGWELSRPRYDWADTERDQVIAFARRVAIVGRLDDVSFEASGGALSGPQATASIEIVPWSADRPFTQADYDVFVHALAVNDMPLHHDECVEYSTSVVCFVGGAGDLSLSSTRIALKVRYDQAVQTLLSPRPT